MIFKIKSALIFSFIIFLMFAVTSSPSYANSENDMDQIDQYITAYVEMNQFSGSILISRNNQIIVNKGYGMANYEHEIPNHPKTKFRIASLTKQFTAMAVLILDENDNLDINDSLAKYIPDYPRGDEIKIFHLLTHTSGIPDHTEFPDFNLDRRVYQYSLLDTVKKFKNKPLEFSPGEKFKYSNSGYILLGYIIEQVSKMPYEEYIEHNIFKPLKMKNSGFEHPKKVIRNFADGYNLDNNEIIRAKYRDMSNAHASGALYSTTEDLLLWDRALYTEQLIGKASLQKMFTPFKAQYGYGWGIVDLFDRKMAGHNGEIDGFKANISRFINDDACIIVLSNFEQTPIGKISVDLAAILFGKDYSIPKIKKTIALDSDILNDYSGKYELKPNFHFVISRNGDQLFCQPTGQKKLRIYPESEIKFYIKEVDAYITFIRNENKTIESLILHQGGRDISAKKIK
ncbi:serine hydrolase [candidate division KSB1 bacterium]|nr:serine hydrolase [candidate division KSB1 bacterium]